MSVTLTVMFREPAQSLCEMYDDAMDAGDAVLKIADNVGGWAQFMDLSAFGHRGSILRDHPDAAPLLVSEVVADFIIEEN